jgi:hypothetical protein
MMGTGAKEDIVIEESEQDQIDDLTKPYLPKEDETSTILNHLKKKFTVERLKGFLSDPQYGVPPNPEKKRNKDLGK